MLARFSERVGGSSGIPHGMTSLPQALKWQLETCKCYSFRCIECSGIDIALMQIVRASNEKREHRLWVHAILERSEEKYAYYPLVRELQFDAERHHQYFRMLITLLTATAQNEIKSKDPRYRPY